MNHCKNLSVSTETCIFDVLFRSNQLIVRYSFIGGTSLLYPIMLVIDIVIQPLDYVLKKHHKLLKSLSFMGTFFNFEIPLNSSIFIKCTAFDVLLMYWKTV